MPVPVIQDDEAASMLRARTDRAGARGSLVGPRAPHGWSVRAWTPDEAL